MEHQTKVRYRMADDARQQAKLLKSEMENYSAYFTASEQAKIKDLISTLTKLAKQIDT